jgi:DNA adenine methylase
MLDPFLKWPGGKRWLVNQYDHLFPSEFNRYLEPFLGGGAVFFYLTPAKAILSDSNRELVNAYQCIKKYPDKIERRLASLQNTHSESAYYRIRGMEPKDALERAIRFLYLNRTCFNGIYRVNLKGNFNVPIGTKDLVEYPADYLRKIANSLRGASIKTADFEETIDKAEVGDFVFIDPPYTVMHNNNNFVKYNAKLFSWADQVRLAAAIKRAARRGAAIMISNADHRSVRQLYANFGTHSSVGRASILAADSFHRRKTTELLITNYDLPQAKPKV